jgi:hypothetical protein
VSIPRKAVPAPQGAPQEGVEAKHAALVVGLNELMAYHRHNFAVLDVIEQIFPREAVIHADLLPLLWSLRVIINQKFDCIYKCAVFFFGKRS